MENITVIIPLHKFTKEIDAYFTKALESVNALEYDKENITLLLVGPSVVIAKAEKVAKKLDIDVTVCENDDTIFEVQINKAVNMCLTEYFTILEVDDTFKPFWFKEFNNYKSECPDCAIYMPIVNLIDLDGGRHGFINEIAWSTAYSSNNMEIGYIDLDLLKDNPDFNVTGSIINTNDFISVGGLKPEFKFASWYEFMMRVAHNERNIYVIPKAGYEHLINRKDSYSEIMTSEINQEYGLWLIKTAKEDFVNNVYQGGEYTLNSVGNE